MGNLLCFETFPLSDDIFEVTISKPGCSISNPFCSFRFSFFTNSGSNFRMIVNPLNVLHSVLSENATAATA